MNYRDITIQTNTSKKGKLDQRSFKAQRIKVGDNDVYVLDETKRDLIRKRFDLAPGCRIQDDGIIYRVMDIWYSPKPYHPFIVSSPEVC